MKKKNSGSAAIISEDDRSLRWGYISSEDEMSGKENRFAMVSSLNTVDLDAPYNGAQKSNDSLEKV